MIRLPKRSRVFWLGLLLIPALVVGLFWGLAFDGEITGFFRIGAEFPKSPFLNLETARIVPGEVGHDGQQFLSIAFDPALQHPGTLEALDSPSYRYRRILYPVLGHILALGQVPWVPYALVLINYGAIVAIVYTGSLYLQDQGRNPNAALWLLGIPSMWITLSLGTAELLSSALLLGSLYFYHRRCYGFSAITLGAGCLTRETLLLVWVALWVAAVWGRIDRAGLFKLGLAGLPCLLWSFYVEQTLGSGLQQGASNNLGLPLVGLTQKIYSFFSLTDLSVEALYDIFSFGLILISLGVLWLAHGLAWRQEKALGLTSLLIGMIFVSLTLKVLGYYGDYIRTFGDIFYLLFLSLPIVRSSVPKGALVTNLLFYLALPLASVGIIFSVVVD